MKLQLIEGYFNQEETLSLLTQLIDVKIKFHAEKIKNASSEEDIKNRESRIKKLQKELYELRKEVALKGNRISLNAAVDII